MLVLFMAESAMIGWPQAAWYLYQVHLNFFSFLKCCDMQYMPIFPCKMINLHKIQCFITGINWCDQISKCFSFVYILILSTLRISQFKSGCIEEIIVLTLQHICLFVTVTGTDALNPAAITCWVSPPLLFNTFNVLFPTEWTWERHLLWPHLATMAELVRDIIHGYRDIMDNKSGEYDLSIMSCNYTKILSILIKVLIDP